MRLSWVDLKRVDLAEQEAGDGIPAVGDALLVGARGGKCERAGGIGRRDGIQLIPAQISSDLECVAASCQHDRIENLPDCCLILREGAGRGS